jgi:hypothetical protein
MDWIISMFVLINGTIMENTLMEKEIWSKLVNYSLEDNKDINYLHSILKMFIKWIISQEEHQME